MKKFDIYLAKIEYVDKTGVKDRPFLVLDDDIFVPVAPITSQVAKHEQTLDYEIIDWQAAGLEKPSVILFANKRLINKQKNILDISRSGQGVFIGHLSEKDIKNLKEKHLV